MICNKVDVSQEAKVVHHATAHPAGDQTPPVSDKTSPMMRNKLATPLKMISQVAYTIDSYSTRPQIDTVERAGYAKQAIGAACVAWRAFEVLDNPIAIPKEEDGQGSVDKNVGDDRQGDAEI